MSTGAAAKSRILNARKQFDRSGVHLNTATAGLPPQASWDALQQALLGWRAGTANAVAYDEPLELSRRLFADMVNVDPGQVAVGSQASMFVGLVAAALPDGAHVLTAEGDFTSVLFPLLAQGHRGIRVQEVPLERVAESITDNTALVALSAVQSSDGRVADLAGIENVCARTRTRILLDATQAAGWLPLDANRYSYVIASGYKWLLSARGTAFFAIAPDLMADVVPIAAGWYAGTDPWTSIYGTPLRLADDAKRFDVSPVWHSWVGQAPALRLLQEVEVEAIHANNLALAHGFCEGVGIPVVDSAIVSMGVRDSAGRRLDEAGISAAMRAGRLRLSFHISTTEDDVQRAIDALRGHILTSDD